VVNWDGGQYYCGGQSGRWSIGTVVNRDGGQLKRGQYQRGQLQRGRSGLWSILTWPNGCHPMNISKWYKNINCCSGISQACIDAVKRKVEFQGSINNKADVLCNLVMDEMKIKKKGQVINGKEYGYVDIGKDSEKDEMPEAENALVFMLICVNED